MLGLIVAGAVAAAGALWIYVGRERLGVAGVGLAALRTLAVAGLVALLLNPTGTSGDRRAPIVLLDASLSMAAAGGAWGAALDSARRIAGADGTILRFGAAPAVFDTAAPGDPVSRLGPALAQAAGLGGPVTVLTDGEIGDAAAIPSALRAIATMLVLPRDTVDDVALVDVDVPRRVAAGDTLRLALALRVIGAPGDTARVTVREDDRQLAAVSVPLGNALVRAAVRIPPEVLAAGTHALTIEVRAPGDREPRTDARLRLVEVSALPSVVVVAAPASWEATFLARELADVVRAPVGAYARITAQRWIDLATQRPVPVERVRAAVAAAQLTVALGDPQIPLGTGPRWRWPDAPGRLLEGEWYPAPPPASPLAARLGGVPWDSLPPLSGVVPVAPEAAAWVGLAARLARRGAERPLLVGNAGGSRELVMAGQGAWRWALRGGSAREAYRGLMAAAVDWLLGGAALEHAALVLAQPVVARGEPLVFRWTRAPVPDSTVVVWARDDTTITDVLRFDMHGESRVVRGAGVWRWRAPAVAEGWAAVEAYAPEYVAGPVTVAAGPASAGGGIRLAGLRERWWLYLLLVAILLGEWGWRMRKGLA